MAKTAKTAIERRRRARVPKVALERRSTKRSPLGEKVSFEVSTHLAYSRHLDSDPGTRLKSHIQDVSDGGVCLLTREPLEAAQIVKLNLPFPHVDVSTPTLAEVRWVKRLPSKKGYQAGLRFLF